MTPHGFRTIASTLLNEQGYSIDAIERFVSHMPNDRIRDAYNRAQYLDERRRMMQAWADYLYTNAFKKDIKVVQKRGLDTELLKLVLTEIIEERELDKKFKNHKLSGDWKDN